MVYMGRVGEVNGAAAGNAVSCAEHGVLVVTFVGRAEVTGGAADEGGVAGRGVIVGVVVIARWIADRACPSMYVCCCQWLQL